jgi:hypothetical protein
MDERALIVAVVNHTLALHALRLAIVDKAGTVEILMYLEMANRRLAELITVVGAEKVDQELCAFAARVGG